MRILSITHNFLVMLNCTSQNRLLEANCALTRDCSEIQPEYSPAVVRQITGIRRGGRHAKVERVAPVGHGRLIQVEIAVILDRPRQLTRVEPRLVAGRIPTPSRPGRRLRPSGRGRRRQGQSLGRSVLTRTAVLGMLGVAVVRQVCGRCGAGSWRRRGRGHGRRIRWHPARRPRPCGHSWWPSLTPSRHRWLFSGGRQWGQRRHTSLSSVNFHQIYQTLNDC